MNKFFKILLIILYIIGIGYFTVVLNKSIWEVIIVVISIHIIQYFMDSLLESMGEHYTDTRHKLDEILIKTKEINYNTQEILNKIKGK